MSDILVYWYFSTRHQLLGKVKSFYSVLITRFNHLHKIKDSHWMGISYGVRGEFCLLAWVVLCWLVLGLWDSLESLLLLSLMYVAAALAWSLMHIGSTALDPRCDASEQSSKVRFNCLVFMVAWVCGWVLGGIMENLLHHYSYLGGVISFGSVVERTIASLSSWLGYIASWAGWLWYRTWFHWYLLCLLAIMIHSLAYHPCSSWIQPRQLVLGMEELLIGSWVLISRVR